MTPHPSCPPGVHFHEHDRTAIIRLEAGAVTVHLDQRLIAVVDERITGARIVELLDRHGLADVPDDASAITAPWPAPNPKDRHT